MCKLRNTLGTVRVLCRSQRPSLLEALPAKHRAPLGRPERNRRFLSALRTGGLRFRPHLSAATAAFGALRFAAFTSFWFVFEPLVREEHLFSGGEYKLGTALRALQHLVVE